jgi:hypothetical protein
MERIKRLIDDHPDAAGFWGFVLFNVLVYLGLSALENRHYMAVRFFVIMGAVGIIVIGKWLIDVMVKPGPAE